jgi:hypothetical protein
VDGGFVLTAAAMVTIAVAIVSIPVVVVVAGRLSSGVELARRQAIAALCAQRGFVQGAVPADFPLLGAISANWLSNSCSSPDHRVAIADFARPEGKYTTFSRCWPSPSPA